jgi:fermentation-respiration switch protein FrsA (DUF1100 family)
MPRRSLVVAAVFIGLYLAGLGVLFTAQRSFIFPAPDRPWPVAEGFETVRYPTSDGLELKALYHPAAPGQPTILFFHGNGDSLSGSLVATEGYAAAGYGLLLHEYRGYAGNPGAPDEAGLYADGRAARAWLASQGVAEPQQVLIGYSLGTGVAAQLALERPPAAVVLIAPYTSIPAVVGHRFRGLVPADLLVRDRFDTAAKLARVRAPVLILHDRQDSSIPVAQGERLARLAPGTTIQLFSGHDHLLGFAPEAQAAGVAWLKGQLDSQINPAINRAMP